MVEETDAPENIKQSLADRLRVWLARAGIVAALVLLAFLAGLLPMGWAAWTRGSQRDIVVKQLRVSRLENELAAAMIDARRGEYEAARVSSSKFFAEVNAEIDGSNGALTEQQVQQIRPVLTPRDEIITLLARNDPAAAEKLQTMYIAFRSAVTPAPAPMQK